MDGDLAGEHDLLERTRADLLDGARDRGLVVLGRRHGVDPEAPGGRGIEQRKRIQAQGGGACAQALGQFFRTSSGAASAASVSRTSRAAARERDLGDDQVRGGEAGPVRRVAAVGGEGEPAERDQARAGRAVGRVGDRARGEPPPGRGELLEACAPLAVSRATVPSAASADPSRSGCSKQNQSSPAAREANTTALGSTSAGTRVVNPSSTGRPSLRARRTARSQRVLSAAASTAIPPPGELS